VRSPLHCSYQDFLKSLFFCRGTGKDTRGTAFVVYEDIYDAKTAVDHLSGFNVANRYLIVLYYQQQKMAKKFDQVRVEASPSLPEC
jgi:RNA recognition motif-containing protein